MIGFVLKYPRLFIAGALSLVLLGACAWTARKIYVAGQNAGAATVVENVVQPLKIQRAKLTTELLETETALIRAREKAAKDSIEHARAKADVRVVDDTRVMVLDSLMTLPRPVVRVIQSGEQRILSLEAELSLLRVRVEKEKQRADLAEAELAARAAVQPEVKPRRGRLATAATVAKWVVVAAAGAAIHAEATKR